MILSGDTTRTRLAHRPASVWAVASHMGSSSETSGRSSRRQPCRRRKRGRTKPSFLCNSPPQHYNSGSASRPRGARSCRWTVFLFCACTREPYIFGDIKSHWCSPIIVCCDVRLQARHACLDTQQTTPSRGSCLACSEGYGRRQALHGGPIERGVHPREFVAGHALEANVSCLRVQQAVHRLPVNDQPNTDASPHGDVRT